MSCLGVHFAITAEEAETLESFDEEQDRLSHLEEVIEERYFANHQEYVAECDKAWDAMHRALTDGRLTWDGGTYPLNHAVLAGRLLYTGGDYIMSLKTPEEVTAVAAALATVTEPEFRIRYSRIDTSTYQGELNDEDLQYTWKWFQNVRTLYSRAAADGRFVLFTADQ